MSREGPKLVGSARCADGTPQRGVPTKRRGVPTSGRVDRATRLQMVSLGLAIVLSFVGAAALAQTAVKVPQVEEKDRAERAVKEQQEQKAQRKRVIEFSGQSAFKEKELRSRLKEQIAMTDEYGL